MCPCSPTPSLVMHRYHFSLPRLARAPATTTATSAAISRTVAFAPKELHGAPLCAPTPAAPRSSAWNAAETASSHARITRKRPYSGSDDSPRQQKWLCNNNRADHGLKAHAQPQRSSVVRPSNSAPRDSVAAQAARVELIFEQHQRRRQAHGRLEWAEMKRRGLEQNYISLAQFFHLSTSLTVWWAPARMISSG